jgi:peptidoglycan biosynthesis protein MviN/MurJ (putative lipid II flippase)
MSIGQALIFWVFILFIALFFSGMIFLIRLKVNNKTAKYVLKLLILVIMGFPISLMSINVYNAILIKLHLDQSASANYKSYFATINILGILGYIIYSILLPLLSKEENKKKLFSFMLDINILFSLFIMLYYIRGY